MTANIFVKIHLRIVQDLPFSFTLYEVGRGSRDLREKLDGV